MNTEALNTFKNGELSPEKALSWFKAKDFVSFPPYFLTHWKTKKSFFFHKGTLLAFEESKKSFIISGEPAVYKKEDEKLIYKAFLDHSRKLKKKVCGFYVGENWDEESFTKKEIGTSFKISLKDYDFTSSKASEVRRSLRKGERQNLKVIKEANINLESLEKLLKKWKSKKLPLKLKFFLSEPKKNSLISSYERWYAVEKNNDYFAFTSTIPYKKDGKKGLYIDHLIYDPLVEKSALSFLLASLIKELQKEGFDEINLGLNPFAKVTSNDFTGRLLKSLYHMPFFYKPKGLHYFKGKFAGSEEKEFFFFEKGSKPFFSLLTMVKTTLK